MSSTQLRAPVTGVMTPLQDVPDQVFATKMVGDGVSIDPVDQTVLAPCDGTVTLVHPAHHALTLTTGDGIEVMIHVGLDTVDLKGDGFEPLVAEGDAVTCGQPLLNFDAELLSVRATSLLTQMLVTNIERVRNLHPALGYVTAGQDVALSFDLDQVAAEVDDAGPASEVVTSDAVKVLCASGLHARPAAVFVNTARGFESQIRLHRAGREVNAKSVTAVMTLDVGHGDDVHLTAWGPDADAATAALVAAIAGGLGETLLPVAAEPAPDTTPEVDDPNLIHGVSASPGLAVGRVLHLAAPEIDVPTAPTGDADAEWRAFNEALDRARAQLSDLEAATAARVGIYQADIFGAQRQLLDDPDLLESVLDGVKSNRAAGAVWKEAYEAHADALAALANPVLAARASDIRDVGLRVLGELTGNHPAEREIPAGSVLIAKDLTASDTAVLDSEKVAAIVLTEGGATSHSSILAQSLGIPAVVGVESRALDLSDGTEVVVDATSGEVRINLDQETLDGVKEQLAAQAERQRRNLEAAGEPAVTTDGHRVEVVCNIGSLDDARRGMERGAEGVGLLRSEFVFMNRATAPTEDEQADLYRAVAEAVGEGNRLIIRTLDIGGDKPLPYLPLAKEDNPFLGQRGIRVGLEYKESVLRPQLRAILKAAKDSPASIHVMFPMIATIDEFRGAKAILEEERAALDAPKVPVGIMVEVPAVAMMAEQFAREADFFSIGTNDLTQYTMAMDRGHPKLAPHIDALNPGVLALIRATVQGAHTHDTWVGVCGALASDPRAIPILLGLGVDELSAVISSVADVKAAVREVDRAAAEQLADRATSADDAHAVRALITNE